MAVLDDRFNFVQTPQPITRLDEYKGERVVRLAATQLGTSYSKSEASKVVAEWIEFFSAGPSSIEDLVLVTRTPRGLFESLAGQSQLRSLSVKWGDYDDLAVLQGMSQLSVLQLRGASSVRSVQALAGLRSIGALLIESIRQVSDLSPIGQMTAVTALDLGGDWMTPRIAHIDSISFLRQMPQLRSLLLQTVIVDDLDYSPILDLFDLEAVRVKKARGMRPAYERLASLASWKA